MHIRLKLKYREGLRYKKGGHHSDNTGVHHRNKLSQEARRLLPPQPKMAMLLENGKTRMVRI